LQQYQFYAANQFYATCNIFVFSMMFRGLVFDYEKCMKKRGPG